MQKKELTGWPQWRGPRRDGRAAWLPETLPPVPLVVWRRQLPSSGVGGIAVAEGFAVLGCRDPSDTQDVFLAFHEATGEPAWQAAWPAPGRLDYGNSPRATPLIHDGLVYLLGAFGNLACADLATGLVLWQRNLAADFGTPPLDWGLVGSPLLVEGRLIVQAGGTRGSLVALDPTTGATLWASGAMPPGHTSFVAVQRDGRNQIVGYDKTSLGGWDALTGERLWTVVPPVSGDFNVPTPIVLPDGLLVSTENNGTRRYEFRDNGALDPRPRAAYADLSPDAHTPVVTAGRLFGISNGLYCLRLDDLAPVWVSRDEEFYDYAALVASEDRLLCLTLDCQLLLIDAQAVEYRVLGRLPLAHDGTETLSHPALVDKRLFVRLGTELICIALEPVIE